MTIDLITADPDTNDPSAFAAQADLAWFQLKLAIPQFNTAIDAFNFNATNSTSTTSLAITVASKSLTVQTSKSYVEGQAVTIARTSDATKWMRGEVTSYNSGTGALVVNVRNVSSAGGTFTDWTISQAAVEGLVNYSIVTTHTSNGHGSSNNKICRYTTASVNTGTAITYADSATLGATYTINEDGIYATYMIGIYSGGASVFGISKNTSQATTAITGITAADRVALAGSASSGNYNPVCRLLKLVVGDIIRPHDDGTTNGANELDAYFSIMKVANI